MAIIDKQFTILVVDDSDIIRNSLKNFLNKYRLEIVTCLNGFEGIQKALEFKPSLIFLDLLMPNFDGIKMLQVIRLMEDLKKIPVIVISGDTNRSNNLAAIEAGAERVILKPLQKEAVIKNVNEVLGTNFLSKFKKKNFVSEINDEELRTQFIKFFIEGFPIKKKSVLTAISNKDKVLLKSIIHEIKGSGSTIGFPKLTNIALEIEKKINAALINWKEIELKCEEIFSTVREIENLKSIPDESK
ncbi:MAG: response regulator [Ignavibacteriaceae bacterium]